MLAEELNIILSGVVGSQAYGLAREGSDIDRKGIYLAPRCDVLGLDGPQIVLESQTNHDPDEEYHELGKFLKLAMKSNPTILEILFLNSYEKLEPFGKRIVDSRKLFPSEPAVRGAYGIYAKSQAERLLGYHRKRNGTQPMEPGMVIPTDEKIKKMGRHAVRLLIQGTQLLQTGEMDVDVSDKRDWIFSMGEMALAQPEAFYQLHLNAMEDFDNVDSVLKQWPYRATIDEILISIREEGPF